jgi:hypothetical protein
MNAYGHRCSAIRRSADGLKTSSPVIQRPLAGNAASDWRSALARGERGARRCLLKGYQTKRATREFDSLLARTSLDLPAEDTAGSRGELTTRFPMPGECQKSREDGASADRLPLSPSQ